MDTREECLDHLFRFVQSGDIDQAAVAAGTALAYLATLESKASQLAALARLQKDLAHRSENGRQGPPIQCAPQGGISAWL